MMPDAVEDTPGCYRALALAGKQRGFDPRGGAPVRSPFFRRSEGALHTVALDFDRFRSERVYRNSAPVQELMADCARLSAVDAEMAVLQQMWSGRARNCGIAAGLFFVGSLFLLPSVVAFVGFILTAALFVAMSVCSKKGLSFGTLDLQDRRYELVRNLLQRLRKDIAPEEPVTLEVDFHPADDPSNLTGRGRVGTWNAESFVQRWLSLQVRVLDGTHLRLGMEERLQLRSRTKTNRRGKRKTKNKQKGTALLHVQLRVKPERHPQLAQLGSLAKTAVRLPKDVKLVRLDVAADRLSLRAVMPLDWEARETRPVGPSVDASRAYLMMLLSLYQVLNYSTSLRKRDAARTAS